MILNVTPTGSSGRRRGGEDHLCERPQRSLATATATLGAATAPATLPPIPSAITGLTVPANRLAVLNASASTDPNIPALPLTFVWTLVSKPGGSVLTTASIGFPTASIATFRPDVIGNLRIRRCRLKRTGECASTTATYTAANLPPVAVLSQAFNVATGSFAFPSGINSYDADGQPISFAWTLVSAPAQSAITSGSINNAQTPEPFFTPDIAGAYTLQLIVTDASASSTPATVTITAYAGTVPPNANAGRDVNVGVGHLVTLSGAASSDPNAAPLALTYQWTFASVPVTSALTGASIAGAT